MLKSWRWIAPVALAGGLVAALGAAPAQAASPVSITLHAKNPGYQNVTGDTVVFYGVSQLQNAAVSGTVHGAKSGDVVTLLAMPFGRTRFAATGHRERLTSSAGGYSFSVRPTVATAYEARVTTGSVVDATSGVHVVYVGLFQVILNRQVHYKCNRSQTECSLIVPTTTRVPASAYHAETAKRWYLYLAVRRYHHVPPKKGPRYLSLDRSARASRPVKITATTFKVVFTFPIATRGQSILPYPNACVQDTESRDGIGLPGRHGCGAARIPSNPLYLG
jgi:hypothetical protein